jgi:hypothetical protein
LSYFSINLRFSTRLQKILKYKFYKNSCSGIRIVLCVQADGQTCEDAIGPLSYCSVIVKSKIDMLIIPFILFLSVFYSDEFCNIFSKKLWQFMCIFERILPNIDMLLDPQIFVSILRLSYETPSSVQRAANSSHGRPLNPYAGDGLNLWMVLYHKRWRAEKLYNYRYSFFIICLYNREIFYAVCFYYFYIYASFIKSKWWFFLFGTLIADQGIYLLHCLCSCVNSVLYESPYIYIHISVQFATCQCALCVTVLRFNMQG